MVEASNHYQAYYTDYEQRRHQARPSSAVPPGAPSTPTSDPSLTSKPGVATASATPDASPTQPPERSVVVAAHAIAHGESAALKSLSVRDMRVLLAFHDIDVPHARERHELEDALKRLAWDLGTFGARARARCDRSRHARVS